MFRGSGIEPKGLLAVTGDKFYRAVSQANAGTAIIVHGGELAVQGNFSDNITPAENIGAALNKVDVRVLDLVNAMTNQSAAESRESFSRGPVFNTKDASGLPMFAQGAYTPANGQQQSTADLTQAAQGNIDRLNRAITRFLDKPGAATRPFQARRLRDHAGLQGLGDAFGATIQGFRVDPSLRADVTATLVPSHRVLMD